MYMSNNNPQIFNEKKTQLKKKETFIILQKVTRLCQCHRSCHKINSKARIFFFKHLTALSHAAYTIVSLIFDSWIWDNVIVQKYPRIFGWALKKTHTQIHPQNARRKCQFPTEISCHYQVRSTMTYLVNSVTVTEHKISIYAYIYANTLIMCICRSVSDVYSYHKFYLRKFVQSEFFNLILCHPVMQRRQGINTAKKHFRLI